MGSAALCRYRCEPDCTHGLFSSRAALSGDERRATHYSVADLFHGVRCTAARRSSDLAHSHWWGLHARRGPDHHGARTAHRGYRHLSLAIKRDVQPISDWQKSPAALLRTTPSLPAAKGATFAACPVAPG